MGLLLLILAGSPTITLAIFSLPGKNSHFKDISNEYLSGMCIMFQSVSL